MHYIARLESRTWTEVLRSHAKVRRVSLARQPRCTPVRKLVFDGWRKKVMEETQNTYRDLKHTSTENGLKRFFRLSVRIDAICPSKECLESASSMVYAERSMRQRSKAVNKATEAQTILVRTSGARNVFSSLGGDNCHGVGIFHCVGTAQLGNAVLQQRYHEARRPRY